MSTTTAVIWQMTTEIEAVYEKGGIRQNVTFWYEYVRLQATEGRI